MFDQQFASEIFSNTATNVALFLLFPVLAFGLLYYLFEKRSDSGCEDEKSSVVDRTLSTVDSEDKEFIKKLLFAGILLVLTILTLSFQDYLAN